MTGRKAIEYIRKALRDSETSYRKGTFWSDEEIVFFLNRSQDWLFQMAIKSRARTYTSRLVSVINGNGSVGLPGDYAHYVTAVIDDTPATLYIGADAVALGNTSHRRAMILGDTVYFREGRVGAQGDLYYIKYPSPIEDSTDEMEDFDETGYNIIIEHTVALLGVKEGLKDREAGFTGVAMKMFSSTPKRGLHYDGTRDGAANMASGR